MRVVKLGGSLAYADNLRRWLGVLAAADSLVIVPGGGPFADQVRSAQARWSFDDSTAHHMALLAMAQFGRMLCALQPGLYPAATESEIRRLLRQGRIPVWMPAERVLAEAAIAHSWDVTADTLAAWLCRFLSADELVLVKSAAPGDLTGSAAALCQRGVLDRAFAGFIEQSGLPFRLLSADDPAAWQGRVIRHPSGNLVYAP